MSLKRFNQVKAKLSLVLLIIHTAALAEMAPEKDCQSDILIFKLDESEPRAGVRSIEAFATEAIRPVADPENSEDKAAVFHITPDYFLHNGNRTELTVQDYRPGNYQFSYRFQLLIPENYVSETNWQIFAQWHDQPDRAAGETWANHPGLPPPLALEYRDKQLHIVHRPKPGQAVRSNPVAVELGVWHILEFNIVWSQSDNGRIRALLNSSPFLLEGGSGDFNGPNIYNAAGNYFKFGIYRGPGAEHSNTIYFKDLEIHSECIEGKS